jgi:hypothetical protein
MMVKFQDTIITNGAVVASWWSVDFTGSTVLLPHTNSVEKEVPRDKETGSGIDGFWINMASRVVSGITGFPRYNSWVG